MDTLPPSVNKLPKTPTFHNRKEVLNMRSLHSSAYGKNSLVFNLCTSVNNLVDVYEKLYFEFWSNKSSVALPSAFKQLWHIITISEDTFLPPSMLANIRK